MSSEPQIENIDWRGAFRAAVANLPETVEVPYERTPEGMRLEEFRRACPAQFAAKLDRSIMKAPRSFDRVSGWDGKFPGPLAAGRTGTGKTRAAWSSLGRLFVKENRNFVWFPVRRLMTELTKFEEYNAADEFFRNVDAYRIVMIDDVDKINWDFASQSALLFSFYDWIYRTKKPCITTTNNDRAWWMNKMGEAFTRRLFDEAHLEVKF